MLPAQRKVVCLGGTDGKHIDASSVMDREFPSHKTTKSLHPMACHVLDIDSMAWSTITCKNAQTGAEPSPRCYHSATLLGKNLFVTGGQVPRAPRPCPPCGPRLQLWLRPGGRGAR